MILFNLLKIVRDYQAFPSWEVAYLELPVQPLVCVSSSKQSERLMVHMHKEGQQEVAEGIQSSHFLIFFDQLYSIISSGTGERGQIQREFVELLTLMLYFIYNALLFVPI